MDNIVISTETLEEINDWIEDQDIHYFLSDVLGAVEELKYAKIEITAEQIINAMKG